jgi:hypothetical protein
MAVTAARATPAAPPSTSFRVALADGARTTVHVAAHPLERTELRVVVLDPPRPLPDWCRAHGIADALVGGFYTRASGVPLGDLRTRGVARRADAFAAPWHDTRSCLHVDGGEPRIAPRNELPREPRGDLLQAGPLLLRGGAVAIEPGADPEGFSAGRAQFDSDITAGRHPRAALGLGGGVAWAVACDGRARDEAGLTLLELAQMMAWLGSDTAVNLDGGGSASLVAGGTLVNRPRDDHGAPPHGGRPICTAIAFMPRPGTRYGLQWRADDLAASSR